MLLRHGLLKEDLAERFRVSPALYSCIFTTWLIHLSKVLGKALVVWPPRESIRDNLLEIFLKSGYGKCPVIIDCVEVFIERPKSLSAQAATWSDYKHHNAFKFLVEITPTGFILFLSSCYGDQAGDRFITRDALYDLLGRNDEVMADKGFQIQEGLLLHFSRFLAPPGARVKSQMTKSGLRKTKEVANLQIHVERATNRIIFFRISKGPIPITMIQHVYYIILTCAALCNLKPKLIKTKAKDSQK